MGAFTRTVEGWSHEVDTGEIRRALTLLMKEGEQHEIRALPGGGGGVAGLEGCVEMATRYAANHQVYYSLNPVALGSERANKRTVSRRSNLLIDSDPVKADPDASATEAEKAAALTVACEAVAYLTEMGWPEPLVIDSGNGFHAVYRCDLSNDDLTQLLVKAWLAALAKRFDTPSARIDRATHDAPRIAKLPGTWARKGKPTEDRPHRKCKIQYEPMNIEPVSLEMLQAAAGMDAPQGCDTNATPMRQGCDTNATLPFAKRVEDGDRCGAYVRRAVEAECLKVAIASDHRNDKLNDAAFRLGTMADWPEMDDVETRRLLTLSAERAGLEKEEIPKTIASGWESGKLKPRKRLEEQDREKERARPDAKVPKSDRKPPPDQLIRFASEVSPKKIAWLWKDRIAEGFITVFAGKTGIGKSFVLCDLAAKLTSGRPLPEEAEAQPPCNVLFISEDPVEYVLVPRLMKLGADLNRMAFMTWDAMGSYTLGDTTMLEKAWEQAGRPRLIIFDPPANFLGGANEHRNSEIREVVMAIVAWMDGKGVSSVFVIHLNRRLDKGVEALDRIMGSVAWGSTSRVAMGLATDPNEPDRCLFAGIKSNLGPKAPTLAYRIVPSDDLATVEWDGEVDISADDALGAVKKKSRGACAVEWLTEQFRERRKWTSEDIKNAAGEAGFSKNAIFSPEALALPIKKRRQPNAAGDIQWWWVAEEGWPEPKDEPKSEETGTY